MNEIAEQWSSLEVDGKIPRETIEAIEQAMMTDSVKDMDWVDHTIHCPVKHHFSPGLYAREMFIPAGTVVAGGIHKFDHLAMLVSGTISILSEEGVNKLTGPVTMVSNKGTKRIAFAHTDAIFTAFIPTDITEAEGIEKHMICETYKEYEEHLRLLEVKK